MTTCRIVLVASPTTVSGEGILLADLTSVPRVPVATGCTMYRLMAVLGWSTGGNTIPVPIGVEATITPVTHSNLPTQSDSGHIGRNQATGEVQRSRL